MPDVSLTRFVDFVIKSGTPKLTVVRDTKKQIAAGYDPATDYYKRIRDAIVAHHKGKHAYAAVDKIASTVTNKSKQTNYPLIATGYKKFLGRRSIKWFTPPKSPWTHSGLRVQLNPELGLEFGGKRYVVKLYFKGDQPRKLEVKSILALMELELQTPSRPKTMALLDVRRSNLITETTFDPALRLLIEAEALAFESIYKSI